MLFLFGEWYFVFFGYCVFYFMCVEVFGVSGLVFFCFMYVGSCVVFFFCF